MLRGVQLPGWVDNPRTRVFKAATGQRPHRYLTQRRIERALLLLVRYFPVAEIGHRVGFYVLLELIKLYCYIF